MSTATLQRLAAELGHPVDPQRFRSNIVLDLDEEALASAVGALPPFPEDTLLGRTLLFGQGKATGAPQLRLTEAIPRCRMVSLDPESTEPDRSLLPHLARHHGTCLGVYGLVHRPGALFRNDPVFLL